jgi:asparagine synthase (glutamine-hydrolysing)
MFAFAIWDAPRGRLFAARDHVGIKPFYYWPRPGGVGICSELRSFLTLPDFPREISEPALLAYLSLGYVPQPHAIFSAARKLPAGCTLAWTVGDGLVEQRYWDPATIDEQAGLDEREAVEHLRTLLSEAVESHLESEVPLGAFLSGGVDSSTVVALMSRKAGAQVRTFSIGFSESSYDESGQAALVARALGAQHTAMTLRPNARVLVDQVVRLYDEPFADSSALPTYLVSALAREQVTVSLSGDGGDELFGGYNWYPALAGRAEAARMPRRLGRWVGRAWPSGVPGRGRVLDRFAGRRERFNARHVVDASSPLGDIFDLERGALPALESWFGDVWDRVGGRDFVSQMTLVDLSYYMPGEILTKVDRASMAVSLEARVPLLHRPLVEFALSLPGSMKVRGTRTKYLLRRAIDGLVPPEVLRYPKRGFDVPLGQWLRGELQPELEGLTALAERFDGLLRRQGIERLVAGHLAGTLDAGVMLWRLVALKRWLAYLDAGELARPLRAVGVQDLLASAAPAN